MDRSEIKKYNGLPAIEFRINTLKFYYLIVITTKIS